MYTLSRFFAVIASVVPSLAVPTLLAPLHTYNGPKVPGRYIAKVRSGADQGGVIGLLKNLPDTNTVSRQYNPDFYNALVGYFDQDAINTFRSSPDVEYVSEDGIMSAFFTQNNAPWNLARISTRNELTNQNSKDLTFPYNYDPSKLGNGVDIYVIDTGIYTDHSEFEGRAKWGKTFCADCKDADGNGHGTHVSGTAAGKRFGVAKKATLIAVKVLNDQGYGAHSEVIAGIEWVERLHNSTRRPGVATISFGGELSIPVTEAVDKLVKSGVHCTVAAGNNNTDAGGTSPANSLRVITVGATDITDSRASYSNYGPLVHIFSPGTDVTSAWIGGPDETNTISGTSMATSAVAGLVAYYLNILGDTKPPYMRAYLQRYATKFKLSNTFTSPNLLAFNNYIQG